METISQIIELGAIGGFIYYALANNREWRRYLSDRNSKLEKALEKHHEGFEKLHEHLDKK